MERALMFTHGTVHDMSCVAYLEHRLEDDYSLKKTCGSIQKSAKPTAREVPNDFNVSKDNRGLSCFVHRFRRSYVKTTKLGSSRPSEMHPRDEMLKIMHSRDKYRGCKR